MRCHIPPTTQITQDVFLVLGLRSNNNTVLFEAPLDRARALSVSSVPRPSSFGFSRRRYVFHATWDDTELTVEIPKNNNNSADDIELFHSVLVEYVTDVRVNRKQRLQSSAQPPSTRVVEEPEVTAPMARAGAADEDLRGRFVLMNQDMGRLWGRSIVRLRLMRIRRLKRGARERHACRRGARRCGYAQWAS